MLLALKISANTNLNKAKPRFLYTSSIHGDEPLGYVLMLHLIDSLLSGYGNVSRITKLVDNIDIYINPLANPDGTYSGGDSTIYGATRYNINNVDLNRSYPNSVYGQNLDSNKWEPETKAFIDYASKIHFTMSANLHGGSELVNYPWDSWSRLAADDNWWQCVSQEFADTIHKYSIPGYFADPDINGGTGISNGYAWYDIYGSRQDYMNFYQHCRESTIEMSNDKIPFAGYLLTYWKYTNRSFFNYIEKSLQGIKGIVTDSSKGKPIFAKVFINGHDKDSSHVWSSLPDGDYHRLIYSGTYDLTFSATGYYSKTFKNINVSGVCDSATVLNVKLVSLTENTNIINNSPEKFSIYPNPNDGVFNIKVSLPATSNPVFMIYNVLGKEVYSQSFTSNNGYNDFKINLIGVQEGIYFGRLFTDDKVMTTKFIITH